MTNIKYGDEMDNYCKIHNLYIDERLESRNTSGRNGNIVIKTTVKYKDKVIIDIESKSIIKEEELLTMIKEKIREIKLNQLC